MTDSKVPAGSTSEIWVIDQITSGVASVERDGGTTTTIPATMLPRGAAEGDVLRVIISPDDGRNNITISLDPVEKARRLERSAAQVANGGKGGKGNIVL
ncbi:MAG: DUF3006 domain-containing protein [Gemmatimonadota bacterium]|nr:DUF3006 domain-containing protein [Gemmatimonadota bacterium]